MHCAAEPHLSYVLQWYPEGGLAIDAEHQSAALHRSGTPAAPADCQLPCDPICKMLNATEESSYAYLAHILQGTLKAALLLTEKSRLLPSTAAAPLLRPLLINLSGPRVTRFVSIHMEPIQAYLANILQWYSEGGLAVHSEHSSCPSCAPSCVR